MKHNRAGSALLVASLLLAHGAYAGSITGEAKLLESPPKLAPVKVTKDQDYCGETLPNETYVVESSGGLKNVVVFLDSIAASSSADPQKDNMVENTGCQYVPRVLAMRKGERLKVQNNDPKLHIPHSYLNERTVFMLSLPFKNTILDATRRIREAGILKLVCDTHAWMLGFIHVFDHPFFAVTDENGRFSIPNVPAGTYTLKAWHEHAGVLTQEITVSEAGDSRALFAFGAR